MERLRVSSLKTYLANEQLRTDYGIYLKTTLSKNRASICNLSEPAGTEINRENPRASVHARNDLDSSRSNNKASVNKGRLFGRAARGSPRSDISVFSFAYFLITVVS